MLLHNSARSASTPGRNPAGFLIFNTPHHAEVFPISPHANKYNNNYANGRASYSTAVRAKLLRQQQAVGSPGLYISCQLV